MSDSKESDVLITAAPFLVHEKPFCVWDAALDKRNMEFLSSMDPDYLVFMSSLLVSKRDTEDTQRAAMGIRSVYSQALEAFVALCGAAVQAPDCVPGWLLKYKEPDLVGFAAKMTSGRGVPSKLPGNPRSWRDLSDLITPTMEDVCLREKVVEGFATAWTRFAQAYADPDVYVEYNNIKHGLRCRAGGFALRIKEENNPTAQWKNMGGSQYGSSFFVPEPIGTAPKNHFRIRRKSRNWLPGNLHTAIILIATSMNNIISYLKAYNGGEGTFKAPADLNLFSLPWSLTPGTIGCSMDVTIPTTLKVFTDEEIRAVYGQDGENQMAASPQNQ